MERKQGEYNVQATNGTENDFPQIAQGLPREQAEALRRKKERWYGKKTKPRP